MSRDKVYIVTSGEYSEYRINAVFFTEEEAESFSEKFGADRVEVWPFAEPPKLDYFIVRMRPESGESDYVWKENELRVDGDEEKIREVMRGWWVIPVFARDEPHALKVANEKRIRRLADRAATK